MNLFAWIILSTLLTEYCLTLVSHVLTLRILSPDPPPELEGVYDLSLYRRSQEYTRRKTEFSVVSESTGLLTVLIFWFSGGFNALDLLLRELGMNPLFLGMSYIGILVLCRALLALPFSLYGTFVLEEKFGFNKTTLKTFLMDHVKGTALAVLLGAPLLMGILTLFQSGGALAWFYCWIATSVILLAVQFIAPSVILPIFNTFSPLPDGELRSAILGYARSIRFAVDDITVMDGSRRSRKSNAFFTGFGKNKRIALFDTLIERHTVPELVAVIAHEMGHYKKHHILQGLVISIVHLGVMFALVSFAITQRGLFDAFGMQEQSVYAGLVFFGLLFSPAEFLLGLGMNMLSRRNEFEADRFAVSTVSEPGALSDALRKLSSDNLVNVTPHRFDVFLHYSHPPVVERIRAIRQISRMS